MERQARRIPLSGCVAAAVLALWLVGRAGAVRSTPAAQRVTADQALERADTIAALTSPGRQIEMTVAATDAGAQDGWEVRAAEPGREARVLAVVQQESGRTWYVQPLPSRPAANGHALSAREARCASAQWVRSMGMCRAGEAWVPYRRAMRDGEGRWVVGWSGLGLRVITRIRAQDGALLLALTLREPRRHRLVRRR